MEGDAAPLDSCIFIRRRFTTGSGGALAPLTEMDGPVPFHFLDGNEIRLAHEFSPDGAAQDLPPQSRAVFETEGVRHFGEGEVAFHIL